MPLSDVVLAVAVLRLRHEGQSWETVFRRAKDVGLLHKPEIYEDKQVIASLEAVERMICNGQPWGNILREARRLSLPKLSRTCRHTSWKSLQEWAIAYGLAEAKPREISLKKWRKMQQREESIRTLELTPQPSGGYIARAQTARGDQHEAQAQDNSMGALMKLSQRLRNQYSGEPPQQDSDT